MKFSGGNLQKSAPMTAKRRIEIFSAGCPVCDDVVGEITSLACPSCEVITLDMHDAAVAARARALGVQTVPAVAINGQLVDCCAGRGVDFARLQQAGLGQP